MAVSKGAVYFFLSVFGALFLGVLSQANNPQGGYNTNGNGNQQGQGYQNGGGRGPPAGQAGQGYNGQNQNGGRGPPAGQAGQEYNGQNQNGGRGPPAGQAGQGYNGQNQNGGGGRGPPYRQNGGQNGGRGPAGNGYQGNGQGGSGSGNGYPNRNGGGPSPSQNIYDNRYGSGSPAGGQMGSGGPAGGNGGPSQYGGGPTYSQNAYAGSGGGERGPAGQGGNDGGPNGNKMGISLANLPPQVLAKMIRFSGPRKNRMHMGVMDVNANLVNVDNSEEMDDAVVTRPIQCEECGLITSLPIYVENEDGPPAKAPETDDKMPVCEKVKSVSDPEPDPEPITEEHYRNLTCEEGRAVGIAWRYALMDKPPTEDEPNPEPEKYIRYLGLVCDKDDACAPFVGNGSIWPTTDNETDQPEQPHNASLCVPGDHLSGVDITYKGQIIYDIRSKCCTSALKPTCHMDYKQLLSRSHIGGDDLCEFCQPQRPTREELVFHPTPETQWYTKEYQAALHRLFLRLLIDKDVEIHNSSRKEDFEEVGIKHKCPFKGTTLQPHDHVDFWVVGGKGGTNGCGLPVMQRVFLSERHGIEYFSRTAKAVMPKSNKPATMSQAVAFGKMDHCIAGCEPLPEEPEPEE